MIGVSSGTLHKAGIGELEKYVVRWNRSKAS
jgi:hypothetical protein